MCLLYCAQDLCRLLLSFFCRASRHDGRRAPSPARRRAQTDLWMPSRVSCLLCAGGTEGRCGWGSSAWDACTWLSTRRHPPRRPAVVPSRFFADHSQARLIGMFAFSRLSRPASAAAKRDAALIPSNTHTQPASCPRPWLIGGHSSPAPRTRTLRRVFAASNLPPRPYLRLRYPRYLGCATRRRSFRAYAPRRPLQKFPLATS